MTDCPEKLEPCHDPLHDGNSSRYHTGKRCIEKSCDRPAGTAWSPYWCQQCNAERMDRISANMDAIQARIKARARAERTNMEATKELAMLAEAETKAQAARSAALAAACVAMRALEAEREREAWKAVRKADREARKAWDAVERMRNDDGRRS